MKYYDTSVPGFRVRIAERQDTELVLGFIRALARYEKLEDNVTATAETLEESLFDRHLAEALIGEYDGKAAGFALYYQNFSTFLGKGGIYLEDIFVHEEFRGRGIGSEFFRILAKIAKERDFRRIEWLCLDWNKPSLEFYKNLGAVMMDGWLTHRLNMDEIEKLAK